MKCIILRLHLKFFHVPVTQSFKQCSFLCCRYQAWAKYWLPPVVIYVEWEESQMNSVVCIVYGLYLVSSFLVPLLSVRLTSLCCLYIDLSSFYPMYFAPWALPQTGLSLACICTARAAEHGGDLELINCGSVLKHRAELRVPLLPVTHPASNVGFAALFDW